MYFSCYFPYIAHNAGFLDRGEEIKVSKLSEDDEGGEPDGIKEIGDVHQGPRRDVLKGVAFALLKHEIKDQDTGDDEDCKWKQVRVHDAVMHKDGNRRKRDDEKG